MGAFRTIAVLLAASMTVPAFSMGASGAPAAVPTVIVSILPQAYFVDRIAAGRVRPIVLVGPGQSPHSYEPTPRQMAEISSASVWLTVGVEFENALKPKIASLYRGLTIVDTTVGVRYRRLEAHAHGVDEGLPPGDEDAGLDPHVWLGRQAVKAMAANIRDTISKIDPAGTATYSRNYDALVRDVDAVYDGLKTDLAPLRGKPVFVYHPSFGYFLDEFGIRQEAVETGGKEPTQKALSALIAEAKADGAKVVFVQAQFPVGAARVVADAIGGVVVTVDPLAGDWLENVRRIGESMKRARK
ncbi:MAG: metal ABC transporter substrate-binding protein [Spirochaetae bacterium HGW-Spirochaetae-3]|jgi:zinc transport system substrate-binding protein|nr:MAG: metal ABC transporter substrate-binding protein [Spirochaetae bacterium HGW-Spirochaetae-3]